MRINGKNAAVTTLEDVIAAGGTRTFPTTARRHAITSSSGEDDYNGTLQVETAVIVGTITQNGNATVTLTSALTVGSPLAVSVAVLNNDTPTQSAAKMATALNNTAAVALDYVASSDGANLILTAKVVAANDATLNIAYTNDTCTGLTPDASSNNTTAGATMTGATILDVYGINESGIKVNETIYMNGVTAVNTVNYYLWINEMRVRVAGSTGSNVGVITATALVDGTVSVTIPANENKSKQAIYMASYGTGEYIRRFNASVYNATAGAITTLYFYTKAFGGVWVLDNQIELDSEHPTFDDENSGFFPEIGAKQLFRVMATVSAGSSAVNVNFDIY